MFAFGYIGKQESNMFFYALTSAGPEGDVETRAWMALVLTTPVGT